MDKEVIDYVHEVLDHKCDIHVSQETGKGQAKTYSICKKVNDENFCCHAELRKLGIINNKRIPDIYKNNSKEKRMQVLAGLMDSDGHHQPTSNQFEITLKSELLLDDVISLARSLGFACYKYKKTATWTHKGVKKSGIYWRTCIVGEGLENIPTKLSRKFATKRIKNKDASMIGFKIEKVEDDDFYGFELDGNNRYMMDDYIITHNSNGKSKCLELFEKAFGEYCCTLPIALLTQKRTASNSATPELARAKSKRFACLQEPGENERLNIGLMKEMTGGDKLYARGLYREGSEFKPQFKMVLTCNHLPLVPSDDGGTWRRIRVVKFESKFCENPDPTKPNEYPIDTELSKRFDDWKEPFMSMLIDVYKKSVTSPKIKEPDEVMECTREYQRRNDIIADFLDNAIERNDDGFVSITDAFIEFKTWLKEEGVIDRTMRKTDFQNYIEKQYGKPIKKKLLKGWAGYRLKSSVADFGVEDEYD
jgi:P4 family phage/plasmid primase-like protien